MRKLITVVALLCGTASADAASYEIWCTKGYAPKEAVLLVTDMALVLYVKGEKPRSNMGAYPAVILGESETGALDVRKDDLWIVEDRSFKKCKIQKLPSFVKKVVIPDEQDQ